MKKIFGLFILFSFVILSALTLISAEEINYSVNYQSEEGIQISSLKYEPYPVNPGEYFDAWIKVTIGSSVDYVRFELVEEFPFSLDTNENAIREYEDFSGDVILHYKVRVDEDAVEDENPLKLKISKSKISTSGGIYQMDINVANAQTDFDLVIQDSTTSEVSLAIANIGKNTANSMIVRIPEQDTFKITGTNGQMVGNLDAGDYTLVSFSLTQVGRDANNPLIVQIDYTDNIGERRSLLKEVSFSGSAIIANSSITSSITGMPSGGPGDFSGFPSQKKNAVWPYIVAGVLILLCALIFIYFKWINNRKINHKQINESKKDKKEKFSEVPEWIKKINGKEEHLLPKK